MKTKLTITLRDGAEVSGYYDTARLIERLGFIADREDVINWRLG